MVWPIVIAAIAIFGLGAAGATIDWNALRRDLLGKSIAVLGPRKSGKTGLVGFLSTGEIATAGASTSKPETHSGNTIKLRDLELDIVDMTDVPGETQFHADWEAQSQKSDIVCYLFDATRVLADDARYEKSIMGDMRHIGEWFKAREKNPPQFFLIATHCDLIEEYAALPADRKADFTDRFWKRPVLQSLINHARAGRNVTCLAGSLKSQEGIEQIVVDIISKVES